MQTPKHRFFKHSVIAAALSLLFAPPVLANPTGAQVVNGSVSMSRPNASTLNITNSPGAIINWQGFSIGANEVTRFIQQSASSAVLNRVVGPDISAIQGQLLSNGRVFLINPAGIVVGPNAMIDTAGFVGSALNLSNADFLAGKLRFSGDATSGSVINQGWIRTAFGGNVLLVAPNIQNSGLIQTPGGELILAAGQKLTVSSMEQGGVQFEVQAPADSVLNVGKLLADGGAVGVFAGTLKHSGEIRANALVKDAAGNVVLQASGDATLAAGSTIHVDGKNGGVVNVQSQTGTTLASGLITAQGGEGKGGDVRVLGNRVGVTGNAVIDASGGRGGGQVLIGGDYRGSNTDVQNAARTFTGPDTLLRADAMASGNGGKVIVWSEEATRAYGTISARGGVQSGNGGFVETSGKEWLDFAARVDTGATRGSAGMLLLDPKNIDVNDSGGVPYANEINNLFVNNPGADTILTASSISASTSNVSLQANNDITFTSAVNMTGPGLTLTAQAGRSIVLNADISTNNANVTLSANSPFANPAHRDPGVAAITMAAGTTINAGTGTARLEILPGVAGATSGNITLATIKANNVSVLHDGPSANGSILRQTGNPLLTVGNTSNVHLEIEANAGGPSSSIGTSTNPITVSTGAGGTAVLESHYHGGGGGIFIDALTNLQVGGATAVFGGTVKGVQTLTGTGAAGPIRLNAAGNLTTVAGGVCGGGAAGSGPICAGLTGTDAITLRASDMTLLSPISGNAVTLLPQAGGVISMAPASPVPGTLQLSQTEINQITAQSLRIGERNGVGSDTSSSGNINFGGTITAPGTASIEFRTGGNMVTSGGVTDIATTNANITLNADGNIGATGAGRLKVNPGTGQVNGTAGNSIFIEQSAGDMALDKYQFPAFGNTVELATANGSMSGTYNATGAGNWALITQGTAKDIILTGTVSPAGAKLTLSPAGSTFINSGTRVFNIPVTTTRPLVIGGGDVTFNNAVTGANLTLNGGNVTVGSASTFNVLTLGASAGTATFNAATSFANGVLMNGGTLAGTGALTVNNGMTWTSGTLSNTGGLTLTPGGGGLIVNTGAAILTGKLTTDVLGMGVPAGTLTIGANGVLTVNGAAAGTLSFGGITIDNLGTLRLTGAGGFNMEDAASITINNGGLLDFQSTASILNAGGPAGTVTNNGTVRKSTSAGTSRMGLNGFGSEIAFTNAAGGTIDVQTGTLQTGSAFTTNAGTINVAAGATFSTNANSLTNAATGIVKGAGTINLGGQTLINNGGVLPGLSPGTLSILGNFSQPSGTLAIELGGTTQGVNYDLLQVSGNVTLGGNIHVTSFGGFTPAAGNLFDVVTAGGTLTSTATVNNGIAGVTFATNAVSAPPSSFFQLAVSGATVPPLPSSASSSPSPSPSATDIVATDLQRIRQIIPNDEGEYSEPKLPPSGPQCA